MPSIDKLRPQPDDRLAFFQGFLKKPGQVGSIIPSSRFLERRIVRAAGIERARLVVELGPGTGGTTSEPPPSAVSPQMVTVPDFVGTATIDVAKTAELIGLTVAMTDGRGSSAPFLEGVLEALGELRGRADREGHGRERLHLRRPGGHERHHAIHEARGLARAGRGLDQHGRAQVLGDRAPRLRVRPDRAGLSRRSRHAPAGTP